MVITVLKLAWRNVWRNKRRTLITLASIAFGLAALLFQQSLVKSLQDEIIEKSTRTYMGHVQVLSGDTTDPKVPDTRVKNPEKVIEAVQQVPEIAAWAPKVIFTGLVSSALISKGSLVVGVDPRREHDLTIIHSYLVQGEYLHAGKDREVILGMKLAREMDLRLGEKMVIMVQGSDGSLSAEAFRVCGIFKTGSIVYDGQIVYIPLTAAQRLLVCGNEVSVVAMRARDPDQIETVQKKLAKILRNEPVKVLTWKESAHEIVSIQEFQDAILLIVLIVIFSIVALGIFNTLLMSLFERIREFGLMMALGANPPQVAVLIVTEAIFLGIFGMILGNVGGALLVLYFSKAGIALPIREAMGYWMPFDRLIYLKFAWKDVFLSSAAALLTSVIASLFPAVHAARLQPADALRHY